jgi:hypothetical protein
MIFVRCLGHIGTSVGAKEITLASAELKACELVDQVRGISGTPDPGFSRFNTIIMVEDGEAFVPAGSTRSIPDGAHVVLIPFSHGG